MAVSLSSLPSTSCLGHGDERCNPSPTKSFRVQHPVTTGLEGVQHVRSHKSGEVVRKNRTGHALHYRSRVGRLVVTAATQGSGKPEESVPAWAKPDSDEPPPWARDETSGRGSTPQDTFQIPFFVYLLASAITAIAAIGSIFEYVNKKPVFGILSSDSIFYAPLLGFFAFTGIPTSAFLWFKSVQAANKEAEEQDKRDGFL